MEKQLSPPLAAVSRGEIDGMDALVEPWHDDNKKGGLAPPPALA
jgi:hypothetical protein